MKITLDIKPEIEFRLNRLVEQYGHNREYYLSELVRTGMKNLEKAFGTNGNTDREDDVMRQYTMED
ncbi:MAG: hypothetical protein H0X43_12675 [Nitrosospira sp.]|nr:hypothetical protein [Nitrosospira sp.]